MPRCCLLVVLAALFSLCGAASAPSAIVVDMDGSVEDYAALATIVQSATLRDRLRLVTVYGASWGYASSVARTVRRFLATAHLRGVTVAIGARLAAADQYRTVLCRGGCARSQGFPATPRDARLRGMPYSRADVTSAFGAAAALSPVQGDGAARANATDALLAVVARLAPGETLAYVALAPLTNFAAALDAAARGGVDALRQRTELHVYEKGHCAAGDEAAAARVFANAKRRVALYLPQFHSPAGRFSSRTWAEFSAAAQSPKAARSVAWLHRAWAAKRKVLEARMAPAKNAFFAEERGAAGGLVALCALDAASKADCSAYRTQAAAARLVFGPKTAQERKGSHRLSGNNVTRPLLVAVTPWDRTGTGEPPLHVFATPADLSIEGKTALATVLWSRWLSILG